MTGATDRPRFRQDLLAEAIDDQGKKFVDVADPDNGTCYRFYEIEYSLACAMDGERDVAGIVKWATDELGMTPKTDEVKSVIATLGSLGFIDTGVAAPAHAPAAAPAPAPAAKAPAAARPSQPAANRWDQPTAMGDADDYLAPGVVVGKSPAAPAPKGIDIELGNVATAKPAQADLPKSDDLELGAPGGLGLDTDKTIGTQEIPLGASGKAPDISVDLADQMSLRPDDVKEAVRASQVMKAVDVPKELQDELEAPKAIEAKKPARRDQTPPPKPRPTPVPAEAKKPAEQPATKSPAVETKKPEQAPARPSAPPAPAPRVSPMLLAALVLVVLGAGAFLAYKFVIQKSDKTDKQSQSQQPPPPKPPEPPAPPPVESEKLASEQPAAQELKAPAAGTVETIVANDTQVKAGDVIVAFAGNKPIATEIAAMQKDIEKRLETDVSNAEKERDAAEKAGNKAGVTAAEKKIETAKKALEDKQAKLATRTADLDKLVIKAAVPGKVEAVAKANAKVAANDVVAKLTPEPVMVATFKTTTPPVTADARVFLAVKGSEQKLSCKVVDTTGGAKIACPKDAAPAGTEVTFAGIDTSAPAEIEMNDEKPEGSGSAAPAKAPAPAPAKAPAPAPAKAPAPAPAKAPVPPPTPVAPTPTPAPTPAPAAGSAG